MFSSSDSSASSDNSDQYNSNDSPDDSSCTSEACQNFSKDKSNENKRQIEFKIIANHNIKKDEEFIIQCDINPTTMCVTNQKLLTAKIKNTKGQNRTKLDCPYKGCPASQLKKLSNNLRQIHGLRNSVTVKKYLKQAKLVCKQYNLYNINVCCSVT